MFFPFLILAGFARAAVGAGLVSRGYVYPVAALSCALWGFWGSWWMIPSAAIAWFVATDGTEDWADEFQTALEWGVPPIIFSVFYMMMTHDPYPVLWGVACFAIGYKYQTLKVIADRYGWSDQVPEFIAGAVLIGGLALL